MTLRSPPQAPRLPAPTREYSSDMLDQFARALTSYFTVMGDSNKNVVNELNALLARPLITATGTATLVAGTATVLSTDIATGSIVYLTAQSPGGVVGTPYISARTAGVSFVITSTSVADTSVVGWVLV